MVNEQIYYKEWGKRKIILDTINPRHFFGRFLLTRKLTKLRKEIKNVCDIGCGVGLLSNSLGKKGFKVHGYDMDKNAIKLARLNKSKNTEFFVGNVYNLKNKSKYDAVISTSMLEHVKDDVKALKNMNKVMKPGGYLLLGVPYQMKYWTIQDKMWGHYRRYEKKELEHKLKLAGFDVKKIRYIGYPTTKWFYFSFYLPAAKRKKKILEKKKLPFYYYALYLLRYLFLIDYFFNSEKKSTNILFIAEKKLANPVRKIDVG